MNSQEGRPQLRLRDHLRTPGPVEFELSERTGRDGILLAARGELDALTAPRFGARIGELVRTSSRDLIVDLNGVTFIDSTGLHVLLNAQRRLTRQSRRLRVICVHGPVRRTIDLARLADTFGLDPRPLESAGSG